LGARELSTGSQSSLFSWDCSWSAWAFVFRHRLNKRPSLASQYSSCLKTETLILMRWKSCCVRRYLSLFAIRLTLEAFACRRTISIMKTTYWSCAPAFNAIVV